MVKKIFLKKYTLLELLSHYSRLHVELQILLGLFKNILNNSDNLSLG
jgi:hypothetical protein